MIFEPTSVPFTFICWPFALPGKATWPTPVMSSGKATPSISVSTSIPMAEVTMSRLMSVEVAGEALDDRAEEEGGEEGERSHQHDHAGEQHRESGVVGAHRAEARRSEPLTGEGSCDG